MTATEMTVQTFINQMTAGGKILPMVMYTKKGRSAPPKKTDFAVTYVPFINPITLLMQLEIAVNRCYMGNCMLVY